MPPTMFSNNQHLQPPMAFHAPISPPPAPRTTTAANVTTVTSTTSSSAPPPAVGSKRSRHSPSSVPSPMPGAGSPPSPRPHGPNALPSGAQHLCALGSSSPVPPRPRRSWSRRSNSWTPEEDKRLVELVDQETSIPSSMSAFKTWSRVAAQLTNRTGKQCRERYLNQLKPGIRRDAWTPDEERILHEAHAKYGNKWVTIAAELPGRTDNCVKNHWNSMLRKRQRREAALKAAQRDLNDRIGRQANGGCHSAAGIGDTLVNGGMGASGFIRGGQINPGQGNVDDAHVITTPTTPSSGGITSMGGHLDRSSSDMDLSFRTGCATPSGLSSTFDVPFSSGIPSPFTASSPITPKRDAKLQISSLVTSPGKDMDVQVPQFSTTQWRGVTNETCVQDGFAGGHVFRAPVTGMTPSGGSGSGSVSGGADGGNVDGRVLNHRAGGGSGGATSCVTTTQGSSGARLMSMSMSMSGATDSVAVQANDGRCSRRSRRLQSDQLKGGEWGHEGEGNDEGSPAKVRRVDGNAGNALAALAMAASSVPPSPLTPESRFSGCGRSRSSSPEWQGGNEEKTAGTETSGER